MLHYLFDLVKVFLGSSLLLPADGCGGTRATKNTTARPPKKNLGEAQVDGQKGKGFEGKGIFARLLSCEAGPRISACRLRRQAVRSRHLDFS